MPESLKIFLLIVLIWSSLWMSSFAQILHNEEQFLPEAKLAVSDLTVLGKTTLNVPIRMQGVGFFAVHSFTFFISYDPNKLSFTGVLPYAVSNVSASSTGSILSINWSNLANPVNFVANTLVLDLLFIRIAPGDVTLTFLPGSKVGSAQGLLPVSYNNTILLQTWQLSIQTLPSQGGTVSGSGNYLPGQTIALSATPNSGFIFTNWTQNGQVIASVPAFNFIMPNADVTISANFTPKSYQVTTQSVPSAGGNTTGAGIYSFGQNVTVNAIPSTGYQFLNWTKNGEIVSVTPSYSFQMPDGDISLWANFEQINYTLELVPNPSDGGSVAGSGSYTFNQQVNAIAIPFTGYHFINWTQGSTVVSDLPSYSFLMPPTDMLLTARFLMNTYVINVQANNSEYGTITGGGSYLHGTEVSLQAVPNEDFAFVAWTENNQTVSFDANYIFEATNDRNLVAVFQQISPCPVPISLSISGLSETTATLNWVSPAEINQWHVLWGSATTDTLIGEGFLEQSQANFWSLTNLSAQTNYVFYVKSVCQESSESQWSEGYFFSTYYVGNIDHREDTKWEISPNPAKTQVMLSYNSLNPILVRMQLTDLNGSLIWKETSIMNSQSTIDLQYLPSGVYILVIEADGVFSYHRIIKTL